MRPFKKKITDAVAYLKPFYPETPESSRAPSFEMSESDKPVVREFAPNVAVFYLLDEGNCFRYVSNLELRKSGMDVDELHRIAVGNLAFVVAKHPVKLQCHTHFFLATMDGNFEASLLMFDELWDETFRQFIPGSYAAVIPSRDVLAFCDRNSKAGIAELRGVVSRVFPADDHAISDQIFVRKGKTWSPVIII